MDHVVLTAIGDDRPGLVEAQLERGGSIEESRMANLMGSARTRRPSARHAP